jgi:hypothetical protein
MANWGTWVALIGGIIAAIGQWVTGYWLPVIGGVIAIVGAIGTMSK